MDGGLTSEEALSKLKLKQTRGTGQKRLSYFDKEICVPLKTFLQ